MKMIHSLFAASALLAMTNLKAAAQEVPQQKPMMDVLREMSAVPLKTTVTGNRISVDSDFDFINGPTPDKAINIVFEDIDKNGVVSPRDHIIDAEIYNAGHMASLQRLTDGTYQTTVYKENFKTLNPHSKTLNAFNDAKITDSDEAFTRAAAFVYKP